MIDYKKMYITLFNRITDAIERLDKLDPVGAKEILISAQQQTEEMYIGSDY